ncbi:MAG: DUF393 domain-containing protein [Acidobacteria bacterium]|uniref:DUF393 domain-containing protein n=1 Tax=Candidatus Polarisedimenticola svalbardensis TaxID=2886004 RepID=A0A8J6XV61_9BACT|nr:DUF393 domain-containing protein [Candidatus Polarisedimenticola svalbardensis]
MVLYDGVCGLCNRAVRTILKRDQAGLFLFASLQSDLGRQLLERYGRPADHLDSMILLADYGESSEQLLDRSAAVLFIIRKTGGWWRVFGLIRLLPHSIRDRLYRLIARNRYRWFGKYDACPLPEKRYQERFLH